ncbi:MAG: VPLPA-CTERM sorting domain-containing protein [Rhodocyclaceae bacterium]
MKQFRLPGTLTACLLLLNLFSTTAYAVAVSDQGTWETTLQARDLDGNTSTIEAYYDTDLNITWLADANYSQTTGDDTDGYMLWAPAITWAAGLNINGISGWRLPDTNPVDGVAYNWSVSYDGSSDISYNISAPGTMYAGSIGSEMAHLFYITLGNLSYCDPEFATTTNCSGGQTGWGLSNTANFSNLTPDLYWSGTPYDNSQSTGMAFDFNNGRQQVNASFSTRAWAVHSGDVGEAIVPVPAAAWLFGSGLLGLVGIGRRRKTT